MSRNHMQLSENVIITTGDDHEFGAFIQLSDKRYARSSDDIQGEGYVLDWDERREFTINLIDTDTDTMNESDITLRNETLLRLANEFCKENEYI